MYIYTVYSSIIITLTFDELQETPNKQSHTTMSVIRHVSTYLKLGEGGDLIFKILKSKKKNKKGTYSFSKIVKIQMRYLPWTYKSGGNYIFIRFLIYMYKLKTNMFASRKSPPPPPLTA